MASAPDLLAVGFALQWAICLANGTATLVFTHELPRRVSRLFAGAWVALAASYAVASFGAAAIPGGAGAGPRILGAIASGAPYFAFFVLLGLGARELVTARPVSRRWAIGLLLAAAALALATSLPFGLLETPSAFRYFLRVGLRSLLGAAVVALGVVQLWRFPEARTRRSPRLLAGALGLWGLTQLYYGLTSLLGAVGLVIDRPAVRPYLPFVGALALAVAGLAVVGWMLEAERWRGALQERRWRLLFERSAAPMAFLSPELDWLRVNEALCDLFGRREDELTGRPMAAVTHSEDVDELRGAIRNLLDGPGAGDLHARFVRPTGDLLWCRVVPTLIRDEVGWPDSFVVVFDDRTGERRAQEARREAERRMRVLVERSSDLVSVLSPDGIVLFTGPDAERVLGSSEAARVGGSLVEAVHPDDRPRVLETLSRIAAGPEGAAELIGFRAPALGARERRLEAAVTNRCADPLVGGLVANTRDVTDRLDLEARFLQAQKMEGIGRLAGGIAHDFNNLLTVVLGNAAILEEALPVGSASRGDVQVIREAAERGAELTRQLLAFARRQVVKPRTLDLSRAVSGLRELVRRAIGPTIGLELALEPEAGSVVMDPGQLQQVVMNLVVNARDAMPDEGRLWIETRSEVLDEGGAARLGVPAAGEFAVLEVRDSGPGLSPEAREHLFEPFFTSKGQEYGTGLGLATCFGIAQQAGGTIVAADPVDVGATFRVYLPRGAAAAEALEESPQDRELRGSETVLVVDDEAAVRALLSRVLRGLGYRVLEAADGLEADALSAQHEGPIAALVTDVVMPGIGGLELAARLRRARPDIRVLFISGYAQALAMRDQVLPEESQFLQKPFRPLELVARLRELLRAVP